MKITKNTSILFSIAALASAAQAATITATGAAEPNRGSIGASTDISNTLVLDSSAGAQYNAGSNGKFGSISATNGAALGDVWNVAVGSLTVDMNSASGTVNALSANKWWMLAMDLNFKNSASGSTAVANINVANELYVYSKSSQYTQYQNINFANITANVNVGSAVFGNDYSGDKGLNTAKLNINSGANVTWTGNALFGKSGQLNITGKFTTASQLSFDANSYMMIADGAEMTLSKFTKFGSFSSFGKLTQTTDDGIGFGGEGIIGSGSVWNIKGKLHTYAGSDVTIEKGASVTLSSPTDTIDPRLVLQGGKLTFNETLISTTGKTAIAIMAGTTMGIGTDISFTYINQITSGLSTILMDSEGILRLTADDSLTLKDGLSIYNFAEDKVYVGTNVTAEELALIFLYSDEGQTLLGNTGITSDGWLTVVPEPAEWAAILGFIAIAFAVYRRRK